MEVGGGQDASMHVDHSLAFSPSPSSLSRQGDQGPVHA